MCVCVDGCSQTSRHNHHVRDYSFIDVDECLDALFWPFTWSRIVRCATQHNFASIFIVGLCSPYVYRCVCGWSFYYRVTLCGRTAAAIVVIVIIIIILSSQIPICSSSWPSSARARQRRCRIPSFNCMEKCWLFDIPSYVRRMKWCDYLHIVRRSTAIVLRIFLIAWMSLPHRIHMRSDCRVILI